MQQIRLVRKVSFPRHGARVDLYSRVTIEAEDAATVLKTLPGWELEDSPAQEEEEVPDG